MRVLFVHHFNGYDPIYSPGIAALAGGLRAHGHEVALHLDTREETPEEYVAAIRAAGADLLAFSVFSTSWARFRAMIGAAREHSEAYLVAGGFHPTFCPDEVLAETPVDAVAIGEADSSLPALADALEAGRDPGDVAGLWVRDGAGIRRNPLAPLVRDLDLLPASDRTIFDRAEFRALEREAAPHDETRILGHAALLASRGCPFRCAYCANAGMHALYGEGVYCRLRSPRSVLAEVRALLAGGPRSLLFYDEVFPLERAWLDEFREGMVALGRPAFHVMARCETISEERLVLLADAGCARIGMGVESGNPALRSGVLNRELDDATMQRAFAMVHDHGIDTLAFCMVGLPGETDADVDRTVALVERLAPDDVCCSVFRPMPGSAMYARCRDAGLLLPGDGEARDQAHQIVHRHLSEGKLQQVLERFRKGDRQPEDAAGVAEGAAWLAEVAAALPAAAVAAALPEGWRAGVWSAAWPYAVLEVEGPPGALRLGLARPGTLERCYARTPRFDVAYLAEDGVDGILSVEAEAALARLLALL